MALECAWNNHCTEERIEGNRPRLPGSGDIGDRSRKISDITYAICYVARLGGALLGFRGASRAAPPSTMRPANRRVLRFALMDAWYFQIASCYVHDFSWQLPAGVSAPSWRGKPRPWNQRSILVIIVKKRTY